MDHHRTTIDVGLDEFTNDFRVELRRLLVTRGRNTSWQIDDICQAELVTLCVRRATLEADYTDGAHYARSRAAHAGADYRRSEAVQRGEGARLYTDTNHLQLRGRTVVSADAPNHATEVALTDRLSSPNPEDGWVDAIDARDLLRKALTPVSTDTRRLYFRSIAIGATIGEAAATEGIRRETANRKISAATKAIRQRQTAGQL